MQSVIFKTALVIDTIWIDKFSIPIFQASLNHPLKIALIFVSLHNKYTFFLVLRDPLVLTELIFGVIDILALGLENVILVADLTFINFTKIFW